MPMAGARCWACRHLGSRADLDRVPAQADPPWTARREAGDLRCPEGIEAAVIKVLCATWQRCCVHFMRNVLPMGFVAALTFKAAVDDPKRFRRSKTVAAHFRLTPRRYQSGEKDNPGHISKAGDVEVRSALFLAANTIMNGRGQPSSLRSFGARLARKKGRKRAMVAVARKLAVVLHAMWTDGTLFCNVEKEVLA